MEIKERIRPLETHKAMQQLLAASHVRLERAKEEGGKIAWATGQAPTDLLTAMNIHTAFPEHHSAACGAVKVGAQVCQVAEDLGYTTDMCSYAKVNLGSYLGNALPSAVASLPLPDILLATTVCTTQLKWWQILSRHYSIPLIVLDTPYVRSPSEEDTKSSIVYVVGQLREAVSLLEDFCGKPYDYAKLQESVGYSSRAARLYEQFVGAARHRPAPISAFDTFIHIGPLMNLRGYPEAVWYYESLLSEVEDRIEHSFSAIGGESYRLFFDGIPIWFRVGWLARLLASYGACTVASVYPRGWIDAFGKLDPESPLESIAESQVRFYLNNGIESRVELLEKLARDFSVDGLIAQLSVSCKVVVPDHLAITREVQKRTGLPAVIIEGDMVDERLFSEEKVKMALDHFMEQLVSESGKPA